MLLEGIKFPWEYTDEEIENGKAERAVLRAENPDEYWRRFPHGEVVELRWEAYHDVWVYEDGYEERSYIGD